MLWIREVDIRLVKERMSALKGNKGNDISGKQQDSVQGDMLAVSATMRRSVDI